jgi:hypothetical protein
MCEAEGPIHDRVDAHERASRRQHQQERIDSPDGAHRCRAAQRTSLQLTAFRHARHVAHPGRARVSVISPRAGREPPPTRGKPVLCESDRSRPRWGTRDKATNAPGRRTRQAPAVDRGGNAAGMCRPPDAPRRAPSISLETRWEITPRSGRMRRTLPVRVRLGITFDHTRTVSGPPLRTVSGVREPFLDHRARRLHPHRTPHAPSFPPCHASAALVTSVDHPVDGIELATPPRAATARTRRTSSPGTHRACAADDRPATLAGVDFTMEALALIVHAIVNLQPPSATSPWTLRGEPLMTEGLSRTPSLTRRHADHALARPNRNELSFTCVQIRPSNKVSIGASYALTLLFGKRAASASKCKPSALPATSSDPKSE